jgi:hypothetical protein
MKRPKNIILMEKMGILTNLKKLIKLILFWVIKNSESYMIWFLIRILIIISMEISSHLKIKIGLRNIIIWQMNKKNNFNKDKKILEKFTKNNKYIYSTNNRNLTKKWSKKIVPLMINWPEKNSFTFLWFFVLVFTLWFGFLCHYMKQEPTNLNTETILKSEINKEWIFLNIIKEIFDILLHFFYKFYFKWWNIY